MIFCWLSFRGRYAALLRRLKPTRLKMILRNWEWCTDAERERVASYVGMTWQVSSDRRWFANALRKDIDELYRRLPPADVPGAQNGAYDVDRAGSADDKVEYCHPRRRQGGWRAPLATFRPATRGRVLFRFLFFAIT